MLYEPSPRLSEERKLPEEQDNSASASLPLPPASTTSTITSVPANQCRSLPLLLEHAQWAVASSTTFTIILAFILQLVALWIRARFSRTRFAELDVDAQSALSQSPATSSSTSPMQHEDASLPLVQEWRASLAAGRSGDMSIMQDTEPAQMVDSVQSGESISRIPSVQQWSVPSTAPSDLSAGCVMTAERIHIEHAEPRLVSGHVIPESKSASSEETSDDGIHSVEEASNLTPTSFKYANFISIPIPSPVVINAANAAQTRRKPMQGTTEPFRYNVAEEAGRESESQQENALRSDPSSPISNLGILHDDDEEEPKIAMPQPRRAWSIQALLPRLKAFYPTPTQSSYSVRTVPIEAPSESSWGTSGRQTARPRRGLRHRLGSESLRHAYGQTVTELSHGDLSRQRTASESASDDEWPWYPTRGARSRPAEWNTTFAFPREGTYPVIQKVRFSHGHGLINVTAIRREKKRARRAALRRRINTLFTLTIEWD
ncbi:hypothetical protein BDZ89DRAFT_479138 [Hymenopellis radicata]|nr:hypothetical protein BDZ89DRAFT_479138 [Hymenopellis radicata]